MSEQTALDRPSPHIKWLQDAAKLLRTEKRHALANTCERAASEIEALQKHRNELLRQRESES